MGRLRIKNGKFYRNNTVVPIELSNHEQIECLRAYEARQEEYNQGVEVEIYAEGIRITDGNENFILGYGENPYAKYAYAEEFAELEGGKLPTVSQLRIVARHRDEINKALEEAGCTPISDDWFWTDETVWWRNNAAFLVNMEDGNVNKNDKNYNNSARAVINL